MSRSDQAMRAVLRRVSLMLREFAKCGGICNDEGDWAITEPRRIAMRKLARELARRSDGG